MPLCISGNIGGRFMVWPLEGDLLTVGRSSRNAVNLSDGTVSKDHAEFARQGDRWTLRDLGSRNGTRVNGEEVREPRALSAGDVIEIGGISLRVTSGQPDAPTQFSPSPGLGSSVRLRAADFLDRTPTTGETASQLVHLLAEAGRVLVLPRPLGETCEEILKFVERAVPAGRLVLLLRDDPGATPVQVAARYRGGSAREPLALSSAILSTVLDECTSVVISDARHDPRFQARQSIIAAAIHSAMAVPLFDNQRVLGLLYADTSDFTVSYSQQHLEVLTLLANMAAVKITNARLLDEQQIQERMKQELASAARIQRGLLPPAPPAVPGLEIETFLETCYEVGGDLYDFHLRSDGKLLFLLGDVAGKGMGAALLMSSFLASARVLYDSCTDPGEFATRLGAIVERSSDRGRFVTGFVGCLDPASGRLDYVNAGHTPVLVAHGGALTALESTGLPFGILAGTVYATETTVIPPGALVAVYSDGIPEAQRGEEFFDDERLRASLLASLGLPHLEDARRHVVNEVLGFLAGAPRTDDLTLVMLRRDAAPAPGMAPARASRSATHVP